MLWLALRAAACGALRADRRPDQPLYILIVDPPLTDDSFADSYWAIWLPAGASAFNVVLMKRFFDNLPRTIKG